MELSCKSTTGPIKCAYILRISDCVFDESGKFIRMKRKYGKFKRKTVKIDYDNGK